MEFIAFDFETATKDPSSACSLAVVRFVDGAPADTHYRLFRPPAMRFDDDNIRIHQIRPRDVEDAPDFSGVWAEFLPYFTDTLAIAHNAEFDLGVLRATLAYYGLSLPHFHSGCTLRLARKVWPGQASYALNALGAFLGYTFQHHRADEDALICGRILLAAQEAVHEPDSAAIFRRYGLGPEEFLAENGWQQGGLF